MNKPLESPPLPPPRPSLGSAIKAAIWPWSKASSEKIRTSMPATQSDLEAVRHHCRRLVAQKSLMSAGASAVPLMGLDIAVDIRLLQRVIEDINAAFGLSAAQLERLEPKQRVATYSTIVALGSAMIGRAVTREVVYKLLLRSGIKLVAKNATRLVPIVGSLVSASIGYAAFRTLGRKHIEDCVRVVHELQHPSGE
jgi:hypothetical protein